MSQNKERGQTGDDWRTEYKPLKNVSISHCPPGWEVGEVEEEWKREGVREKRCDRSMRQTNEERTTNVT